jgi:S1-C subfamily serine protease
VEVDDVTMTLIQTSAAINFGNSGGALIDRFGRVVGITTIKIVSGDGSAESLGFAIPSVRVKYVADRLIDGQTITPGVLGITVNTLPVEGLGLEIISVTPGSDAEKKGLRPGDILLQVDGTDLTGVQILSRAKIHRGAGDTMVLTVARDGQSFDVEVMLTDPSQLEGY